MSENKEAAPKSATYSEAASKAEGNKTSDSVAKKKPPSWKKNRTQSTSNTEKKTKFQGGTAGLEDHIFIFGKGMITKWITSKEKLFAYIGKKYSMSEVKSLENGKPTLVGYIKPKEVQDERQMKNWSYIKKEEWKLNLKRWNEQKAILTRNLSACYAIIWGQMTLTLKNKVKRDPSYQKIYSTLNAPKLFAVMSRICNEADTVDHAESRLVESLYSLLLCNGGNMTLPEYYEIFTHRVKSAKAAGLSFSGLHLIDVFFNMLATASELDVNEDELPPMGGTTKKGKAKLEEPSEEEAEQSYEELSEDEDDDLYQDDDDDEEEEEEEDEGLPKNLDGLRTKLNKELSEQDQKILALIFLRRAAIGFPLGTQAAKVPDGEQHDKIKCNKCGRLGHSAKQCYAKTKVDGSPLPSGRPPDTSTTGTNMHVIANPDDFNFDDELDQDEIELGYGYLNSAFVVANESIQRHCMSNDHDQGNMNPNWILLDNQSTVNIFSNPNFLTNIRKSTHSLTLCTNTGSTTIKEMGDLPGVGPVWLYRKGIANILSFHKMQTENHFGIEYTSNVDKNGAWNTTFTMTTPTGITRHFNPDPKGLYFIDCTPFMIPGRGCLIFVTEGTTMMNKTDRVPTVTENKSRFSRRDQAKAKRVRRFQHIAGHVSDHTLLKMATYKSVNNCPILPRDIKIARDIYGPSVYSMKGKTTWTKPTSVNPEEIIALPQSIEEYYKDVTLSADVLHVNQIPFLTTISKGIHYGTIHALPSMKLIDLSKALGAIIRSYSTRGFVVQYLLVDGQFKGIDQTLVSMDFHITVNVVSKGEHVPEVERYIRSIKERCRATYSMLPFTRLPKRMIIGLLSNVVFYLNAFPWENGISDHLSPLTLVEGIPLDYNTHFQVLFGEYAQTYDGTDNSMKERTTGAIALGPSGNLQGGVRFFSLSTGEFIHRSKQDYTLLPIPEDVIKRIDRMARKSRAGLTFSDRHIQPFNEPDHTDDSASTNGSDTDDDDDPDYIPEPELHVDANDSESDNESHTSNNSGLNLPQPHVEPTGVEGIPGENFPPDPQDNSASTDDDSLQSTGVQSTSDDASLQSTGVQSTGVQSTGVPAPPHDSADADTTMSDPPYVTRSGRTVTQSQDPDFVYAQISDPVFEGTNPYPVDQQHTKLKRAHDVEYQHFVDAVQYIESSSQYNTFLQDYTMAQMSVRQGLKKFGAAGKQSVMKEIENLVSRDCFGKVPYESLTSEQKQNALPILMFMVMKRDGRLKSRGCADGRPQRLWTTKQEVSSPTPSIEALKYIFAVIGLEKRDVASFDLPAQFLQTEMDELLHLKITGAVALLLCEFDPTWKEHLRRENGRPVIYAVCNKAIYGTLNAAILAYRKLTGNFAQWGYEMNPYDPCVWNKIINEKQMTIAFHVDDGLASHVDPKEVTHFLKQLEAVYGKTDPLTITRGKRHEYLGMTIDFSTPGEVNLSMYDYVQKLINKLPKDMLGERATAAPEYLFKTSDDKATKLSPEKAEVFHTITATALYLSIRTRPDLQLAIGFLCTRVRDPDEHDWKKLTHLVKYLQRTRYIPLIIRSDGNGSIIYMDGAHAVHADMKGHGGLFVTEGKGAMYSASGKIKINTLSSTETEFVQLGQKLPKCVWFRLFRIEQGGYAKEDILMQDNQSAILLANNGRYSVGKGSKHVAIRYFFVTDRIKQKEFKVVFCPTKDMTADYLTKPLQGALFYKFRNDIQGVDPNDFGRYETQYYKTVEKFGIELESDKMVAQHHKDDRNHRSVLGEGQTGAHDSAKNDEKYNGH